jgi:peroxiredoxin Q/BCP
MTKKINLGDTIPSFSIIDCEGNELTDQDLIGIPVVLYFYPKDDTPGCVSEACSFRDHMDMLDALDVMVIGVSPDSAESHQKFENKYDLNFTLLPDENLELCRKFGVVKEVNGKTSIERTTFIINLEGKIHWLERPVLVDNHVERILDALHTLEMEY